MESEFRDEVTASEMVPVNHAEYARYSIKEFIPNFLDGLKLVARRLIWTMGTRAELMKCTKLVSDTMSNLHPHGNLSLEGAAIKLCQPFTQCMPLVHAAGNVGAVGNAARPSAPRYLDVCRSEFSVDLFFNKTNPKTLTYIPNELNDGMEPAALIPVVPCLFIGCQGIAMGFKSEIPMYNFIDICDLTLEYIKHRKNSLFNPSKYYSEYAKYLVPSYPMYSLIRNNNVLYEKYSKGIFNAPIIMDGCLDVMPGQIHLRSIPYSQTYPQVLDKLKEEMAKPSFISSTINEVANLLAASDTGDVKITLKRGVDVFEVLEELKRQIGFTKSVTPIWNFSDNEGTVYNLTPYQLIEKWYIERYRSVLGDLKITQRELNTQKREIEAKVMIVDHTDEVTNIIKTSTTKQMAAERLVERFKEQRLTLLQAEYITSLQLHQLTSEGKDKLLEDLATVTRKIAEHTDKFADIDLIIIHDIEAIRAKYANKIVRKCAPPDYLGCLHINDNGIVQVRTVPELAHQLRRWYNEQVDIEMYPSGKSYHVKYLDSKGYTEDELCFPKAFKAHALKSLKYKPKSTVILNDGQIYRMESMVRPTKGQYIPIGEDFMGVTDKGVLKSFHYGDIPKRQQLNALGVMTDLQFVSSIVADDVIVGYYDNKVQNEVHLALLKPNQKVPLSILSKPVVFGMWRPSDPIAFSVDDKYLNRCNTKHLYFKDAKTVLGDETHIVISLNKRSTSNKKNLVQIIKGIELYGVEHLNKVKDQYEFI